MKKQLFLGLFLLVGWYAYAQIGISAAYLNHNASNDWLTNTTITTSASGALPGAGIAASVDYRLKLQSIRIEFYPYLGYSRQEQTVNEQLNAQMTGLHLGVNSRIYPLDLEGDCDCPTWRKEGPTLEKGLFLQLGAGVSFQGFELALAETSLSDKDTALFFGGGLGFDIGVNDLLTITPMASIQYYPEITWNGLEDDLVNLSEEVKATTSLLQYQLGIHLGFHLNK